MLNASWLLLLHQIPPKPAYFRAKVLKRLTQVGALQVKNSAYLLPNREDTLEDFEWIRQEITQEGGQAWLFRAEALEGLSSSEIEDAFRQLRATEYGELLESARAALNSSDAGGVFSKLARRQQELHRIDFFPSPVRLEVEAVMNQLEKQQSQPLAAIAAGDEQPETLQGKTWVTRKGIKEDRIASAWLIRRFIDPMATFRFVDMREYSHHGAELRFDMFEGEFTHRGELCTFEVLLADHHLTDDGALVAIAESIHDVDLKDDRYQRPETPGIASMIDGLCLQTESDEQRLERGSILFDGLYESLKQHTRA